MVESLEALHAIENTEDRTFRVVIYAMNQKGRSPKIILKDLLIGDRDHHSAGKLVVQIEVGMQEPWISKNYSIAIFDK